jgi:hypothetical protein
MNADVVAIVNQIPALAGQFNKALADFIGFANAVKFVDDTATGFLEDVKRLVTVIQQSSRRRIQKRVRCHQSLRNLGCLALAKKKKLINSGGHF